MEDAGIFYGDLVNFSAIVYSFLGHFCIFCGNFVYFPRFGILYQEKSGNPALFRGQVQKQFFRRFYQCQIWSIGLVHLTEWDILG
jgi:hypothetical protein